MLVLVRIQIMYMWKTNGKINLHDIDVHRSHYFHLPLVDAPVSRDEMNKDSTFQYQNPKSYYPILPSCNNSVPYFRDEA